jgi:hypothetical protein
MNLVAGGPVQDLVNMQLFLQVWLLFSSREQRY